MRAPARASTPRDAVIGGGVSGDDEDPIGEPGIPDEVDTVVGR